RWRGAKVTPCAQTAQGTPRPGRKIQKIVRTQQVPRGELQMKRLVPAVMAGACMFAGAAHAQTQNASVTLYGIADISIRYLSTGDDQGHSRVGLSNGAISNSRWGLRGVEDLGNGNKAFFRLESGFNVQNGT